MDPPNNGMAWCLCTKFLWQEYRPMSDTLNRKCPALLCISRHTVARYYSDAQVDQNAKRSIRQRWRTAERPRQNRRPKGKTTNTEMEKKTIRSHGDDDGARRRKGIRADMHRLWEH